MAFGNVSLLNATIALHCKLTIEEKRWKKYKILEKKKMFLRETKLTFWDLTLGNQL